MHKLNILYHVPHLNTIYAGRTIYNAYKNAFTELGHDFKFLTSKMDLERLSEVWVPNIVITSLNIYNLKYLDLKVIKKLRNDNDTVVFFNVPFWKSAFNKMRLNEASSISSNDRFKEIITSGNYGDYFFNSIQATDSRMIGFKENLGINHITIPLAADTIQNYNEYDDVYKSDISFLGTYLPGKRKFFKDHVFPLKKEYNLRLYGQDWTISDRVKGNLQKLGQFLNLPVLKNIQKPKLPLDAERKIYSSSTISLNVHESYQIQYGGDCNERTFKVPACRGFQLVDNVTCIQDYFKINEEVVVYDSADDLIEKIHYYMNNPTERERIIEAGYKKVLKEHTYFDRAKKFIELYNTKNG